jgi:F0F1-type ATP synthase membrane subunit b/b'
MLTETAVSAILQASITGAGLVLAVYALMTPILSNILDTRGKLLRNKREEFDKLKAELDSEDPSRKVKQLEALHEEINLLKAFPKYLGWGILVVFILYFISVVYSFTWLTGQRGDPNELFLIITFTLANLGFLVVGGYNIGEVARAMREEWKTLEKAKKEAEKTTQDELQKIKEELDLLKRKEDMRVA